MASATVVGGGPAGLSAALFLEKNGVDTIVFDGDATWMHKAHLFNYPGIGSVDGSAFMETLRTQVDLFGVERHQGETVEDVATADGGFTATTAEGEYESDYLVLATGANRDLAEALGCEFDGDRVAVNLSMETSVDDAYATGAMVRAEEWQAVISAGDGAAAALDILGEERGEHFHDFETPDHAREQFGGGEESE